MANVPVEYEKTAKYFLQTHGKCFKCGRKVDVVSTNLEAGLRFSRHFTKGSLKLCRGSLEEYTK